MIGFKQKKDRKPSFPNLIDSLNLYKDAIIDSVEDKDLKTAKINFAKLISVLERHNRKENRLNEELNEAKKRFTVFQKTNDVEGATTGRVSVY